VQVEVELLIPQETLLKVAVAAVAGEAPLPVEVLALVKAAALVLSFSVSQILPQRYSHQA
jgi:hypothetical protein